MKRLALALVLLLCVVCLCACGNKSESGSSQTTGSTGAVVKVSGDYQYTVLANGTAQITKYNGTDETVVIPEQLDGRTVTSIGDQAFYDCRNLTSITIPDSVTSIGYSAFDGCSSLTSITIPASVTSIGTDVFKRCSSLVAITVPRDSYAEQYCKTNNLPYTYPDSNDWLNN